MVCGHLSHPDEMTLPDFSSTNLNNVLAPSAVHVYLKIMDIHGT